MGDTSHGALVAASAQEVSLHVSAPNSATGKKSAPIHFNGFNAMRFLAAWAVLIYHIEVFKARMGLPNRINIPFFRDCGNQAVTFFFVLSGFLITYLLFAEKERTGAIAVKDFYIRRILRLWPVYYLVIAGAFLLWPYLPAFKAYALVTDSMADVPQQVALYVLMLPNVVWFAGSANTFAAHVWSIGVEEQFYLAWPLLLKNARRMWVVLLAVLGCYLVLKFGFLAARHYVHSDPWHHAFALLFDFTTLTRFDCMAIGGLGAWVLYFKVDPYLKWFGNGFALAFGLAASGYMLLTGRSGGYLEPEAYAVCFVLIIMGVAKRPARFAFLEILPLHYLGKISYGLYMYHTLALLGAFALLGIGTHKQSVLPVWQDVALYIGSTLASIALAALSYELLERRFIRLKGRFAKVTSKG